MPRDKYRHFVLWDNGDGSVLCCGGWDNSGSQKGCFKYAGEEWLDLGDILLDDRVASSAVELSDGRYWICGGGYELMRLHITVTSCDEWCTSAGA